MALLFSNRVSKEFADKVQEIADRLGIFANWIMLIIFYETKGTFDPSIQNEIGATGLFQFLPKTAIGLGTTTEALKNMSAVDQLEYGYELLKPYKGKMDDFYSTYQAVFYPASLGQPDSYVFPSGVVSSNPSFFTHGSNMIGYRKSLDDIVYKNVPTQYYPEFFKKKETFCRYIKERSLLVA